MKNPGLTIFSGANSAKRRVKPVHEDKPAKSLNGNGADVGMFADSRLTELLGIDHSAAVASALREALLDPVAALTANPGKRLRAQVVSMTYRLFHDDRAVSFSAAKQCRDCADVIELMHAGSLIVDDIEDGSKMRRGRPALHVQFGVPLALNAGNWLYFWPFELLKDAGLAAEQMACLYERYNRTLLRAHFGQALDLGAKVPQLPQSSVAEVCLAGMTLKTGALMGFAAALGGTVAGKPQRVIESLDAFGVDLGIALQMYDDLGNVIGKCDPQKRFEDLLLSRPSWVWACAANCSDAYEYETFLSAVAELPNAKSLESWIAFHDLIPTTRASARQHLDYAFDRLKQRLCEADLAWSSRALHELRQLGEEIAVAYG
ncbi:MAG: polyprenyl synthetase family protein [Candidatus Binatia bacterium]